MYCGCTGVGGVRWSGGGALGKWGGGLSLWLVGGVVWLKVSDMCRERMMREWEANVGIIGLVCQHVD